MSLITPLEAFQLFCRELKIENSDFAKAIEGELKDCVISRAKIRELENKYRHLLELNNKTNEKNYHLQVKLEKQDEILRIIKEKKVDVFTLTISGNVEMYNKRRTFGFELTQQEFDLFNEVLK